MADREKVIKAIEICYTVGHSCTECPLFNEDDCNDGLMQDVLALLREQEPVKPYDNPLGYYRCGNCGTHVHKYGEQDKYCPRCGRKVKWE